MPRPPTFVVHCITGTGEPYDILAVAKDEVSAVRIATDLGHHATDADPQVSTPGPSDAPDLSEVAAQLRHLTLVARSIEASGIIRRPVDRMLWSMTLALVLAPLFWWIVFLAILAATGLLGVIIDAIQQARARP